MRVKASFVWDFDGVIVETPHEEAWAAACREWGLEGFDHEFYEEYVSGRPRLEGARNVLSMLGGLSPSQPDFEKRVAEFAERKTEIYLRLVGEGRYRVRRDVVNFISYARREGIPQVLASASRNVLVVLRKEPSLLGLFDADVSGSGRSKDEVLSSALRVVRERWPAVACNVLFEDSPAGVEAGRLLGFKVVGCFNPRLAGSGANYTVESFEGLNPLDVLRKVGCEA
ncbi:HAD family hydrolase [Thermofilum pendens]|uniref:HAD-superfamily hydrolase, subfamily IA, variant 3 n=1 Tax=Thermofilum pendens (strain DSM 2475 / Hrk 5) TaxID=368408 RepID=A1RZC4_THEPD|nr:HAD family hydrolase [Thermofilum pendens]ABL78554.1 HAD-superfamily hydrolase, subfamily IA, variant 3 [Thermofilum pendens Hrk 5]